VAIRAAVVAVKRLWWALARLCGGR
jgi:hypothetical protein